jgi:polysaccharide pyruvyl transferase WcaK-like protein
MILSQEYIHLKNTYPDAIFHIFTYDTIGTQEILDTVSPSVCAPEYVHYFPHYIRRRPFQNIYYFFKNIYTLAISDLVVCGGGGIFYEDGTHSGWRKRIWQWYMRAYIAGICGARIYWWSISLETADDTHIQSLKRIFSIRNTTVTVRDTRSKELLQKISITADVVPDMAMMTQGTYDQSLDAISHSNPQSKYVGISLRSGHIYDTHIHTLLDYIQ